MATEYINVYDRSAEQIKESVLQKMPGFVPEMTDFDETNPFIRFIDIWASMSELLHYYLDRSAEECYLTTLRKFSSAVKIANMFDYRIKGTKPAIVDLKFYFDNPVTSDVIIPQYSQVQTKSGIPYLTLEEVTILNGTKSIIVAAKQFTPVLNEVIGTGDGTPNQKIIIDDNVIEENLLIEINSIIYTPTDSFAYSKPTDTHYRFSKNEFNQIELTFGDGVNAVIPPAFDMIADYYVSEGVLGNVEKNTITEIISSITVPSGFILKCTNEEKAAGGSHRGLREVDRDGRAGSAIEAANKRTNHQGHLVGDDAGATEKMVELPAHPRCQAAESERQLGRDGHRPIYPSRLEYKKSKTQR